MAFFQLNSTILLCYEMIYILLFRFIASHPICMETFKDHPQLGRFTLRDEGTEYRDILQLELVLTALFQAQLLQ